MFGKVIILAFALVAVNGYVSKFNSKPEFNYWIYYLNKNLSKKIRELGLCEVDKSNNNVISNQKFNWISYLSYLNIKCI